MKKVSKSAEQVIREAVRQILREMPKEEYEDLLFKDEDDDGLNDVEMDDVNFDHLKAFKSDDLKNEVPVAPEGELPPIEGEEVVDEVPEEVEELPKKEKQTREHMKDVGGASLSDIAKELGFAVSGAQRAVDVALDKARWLFSKYETGESEVLILNALSDYVDYLDSSGELSPEDVSLLKDHPTLVQELDGFREFLHKYVQDARKEEGELASSGVSTWRGQKLPENKKVASKKKVKNLKESTDTVSKFSDHVPWQIVSEYMEDPNYYDDEFVKLCNNAQYYKVGDKLIAYIEEDDIHLVWTPGEGFSETMFQKDSDVQLGKQQDDPFTPPKPKRTFNN